MRIRFLMWLHRHPSALRLWRVFGVTWMASIVAMLTAPTASAAGIAGAFNWTGLHSSQGIPIGQLYISMVKMLEAVRESGPPLDLTDPGSYFPAFASAVGTGTTYSAVAAALAAECSFLIAIVSITLSLVKFALMQQWLGWLVAAVAPVIQNIIAVGNWLYLLPASLLLAVVIGGYYAFRHGAGIGYGVMAGGIGIFVLALWLMQTPPAGVIGEDGVLGGFQGLGFSLAMGVGHNGPIAAGDTAAQLDVLLSWLVDALCVNIIQLVNFGGVVNGVGGCSGAYASAVMSGVPDAPAHAMNSCGAPWALINAQQLDFSAVGLFFVLNLCICVVCLFLSYISIEVVRIGWTFVWNFLMAVGALFVAPVPGAPREFAKKRGRGLVGHGVESMIVIAGLGVLAIWMGALAKGGIPGTTGLDSPVAKILAFIVMTVGGVAGLIYAMSKFGHMPIPMAMVQGARNLRARYQQRHVQYNKFRDSADDARDRGRDMLEKLRAKRSRTSTEDGGEGRKLANAPARQSHPATGGGGGNASSRPRTTPAEAYQQAHDRAGSGPGRGAGSPDRSTTRTVAKTAVTVAAPEVAAPVKAGTAVLDRVRSEKSGRHQQDSGTRSAPSTTENAPGRSNRVADGSSAPHPERQRPETPPAQRPRRNDDTPPPGRTSGPGGV